MFSQHKLHIHDPTAFRPTKSPHTEPTNSTIVLEEDEMLEWDFFFFDIDKPGATILIGAISIVHSLFHLPHCLMYRRLGILTAFWSFIGLGLVIGAVVVNEVLYDIWIWYSLVYVPVMLATMVLVLITSVWALDLKLFRSCFAACGMLFYMFMFYCIVYVNSERLKIFTTTTTTTTTTTCPTCEECTTEICTVPPTMAPLPPEEVIAAAPSGWCTIL